ncbi:MAG: hypothetical protein P3B98_02765 [Gemmatimonadota bacterium]|nr:hypothetical protein [Gemmatimonadota bacterium]
MGRPSVPAVSDDDIGLMWMAVADFHSRDVLETIRYAMSQEGLEDPVGLLRWLRSALTMRDLGALPPHIGFFCIAFAAENVALARMDSDPELTRLSALQRQRAVELGVDEEEWDFLDAQPPDVRRLSDAWAARADALEIEVLEEAGAHEEAAMRRRVFQWDARREEGRAAIHGPLESIEDFLEDAPGTRAPLDAPPTHPPRDPFML